MPPDLPIFVPRPEIIPRILDDLCDPDLTLREIAQKAQATVEALSLWMSTPDIAARIELIQSTIAQRTRLAATCFLPAAVRTVNRVLEAYEHEEDHVPIKPGSIIGHEYRRRSRESARRACNLLLRLARFHHEPARRSSPAGGGGSRSEPEGAAPTPRRPGPALDLRSDQRCADPLSPGDRAERSQTNDPVEIPLVPAPLRHTPEVFATAPTTNGNGCAYAANHEHWP